MERHPDLADARESLEFWERRLHTLPRRDKRGRREAAEHVERWRRRVAEAERREYGPGAAGAIAQLATEGRLPQPVRDTTRRMAKAGRRTAKVLVVTTVSFMLLFAIAVIAVIVALV